MNTLGYALLVLPAVCMGGSICLPSRWVNSQVAWFRPVVTYLVGLQAILATGLLLAFAAGAIPHGWGSSLSLPGAAGVGTIGELILYDGIASLMFALVSFIGWVICSYAIRYLDGEATQGRYYRWTAFTIGAVSLMVVSGNLLMFLMTWVLTSLGLHQLLLHYGQRPGAKRAAWTKFAISRLGDAALVAASLLLYGEFKTLDFADMMAAASSLSSASTSLQIAGFLLVVGAVTKSAQFPFHTWLPLTMETPTPVSAFMHAGIVNAGGYLIVRTSPIVSLTPWALTTLAFIGGVTACYGAVVMLTQTSVKKSLAYSTIAQMGFMMLQCGLGAYSAAMLHIVAHSLYKAHAFLSSGSVVAERAGQAELKSTHHQFGSFQFAMIGLAMMTSLYMALLLFGLDPLQKSGGLLLGGILTIAMTYWVSQAFTMGNRSLGLRALATGCGLCLVYAASFRLVDWIVSPSLPNATSPNLAWLVFALLLASFICICVLQNVLASERWKSAFKTMVRARQQWILSGEHAAPNFRAIGFHLTSE
jgi:NAD(P)H-quinone oxidoreductase subunit 5